MKIIKDEVERMKFPIIQDKWEKKEKKPRNRGLVDRSGDGEGMGGCGSRRRYEQNIHVMVIANNEFST